MDKQITDFSLASQASLEFARQGLSVESLLAAESSLLAQQMQPEKQPTQGLALAQFQVAQFSRMGLVC
jgi:hypothetical protein